MELLSGRDLYHVIKQDFPFSLERVGHIGGQILGALDEAHAKGVVHRDLKPENVMLLDVRGESDFVKVCDFGIAKVASERDGEGSAITMAGMVCGTPEYMSPEQARGDALDGRSDLYAAAVILYQMVTGDVPFRAESALGVITKHLTEEPTPPSKRRPRRGAGGARGADPARPEEGQRGALRDCGRDARGAVRSARHEAAVVVVESAGDAAAARRRRVGGDRRVDAGVDAGAGGDAAGEFVASVGARRAGGAAVGEEGRSACIVAAAVGRGGARRRRVDDVRSRRVERARPPCELGGDGADAQTCGNPMAPKPPATAPAKETTPSATATTPLPTPIAPPVGQPVAAPIPPAPQPPAPTIVAAPPHATHKKHDAAHANRPADARRRCAGSRVGAGRGRPLRRGRRETARVHRRRPKGPLRRGRGALPRRRRRRRARQVSGGGARQSRPTPKRRR